MKSLLITLFLPFISFTQFFTPEDTLRGSITKERAWWDVLEYQLEIKPDISNKKIKGSNQIYFMKVGEVDRMQLDLQYPMKIDSVIFQNQLLKTERQKNVYYVNFSKNNLSDSVNNITVYFSGQPHEAKQAPWDGGWVWKTDAKGRPFVSVACQGLGASAWYPCKDHQSDEPENGAEITLHSRNDLIGVSNGRLVLNELTEDFERITKWKVKNPINNYNIIPSFGYYTSFSEVYEGENGALDCEYWVLDYELEKAKLQFQQVPKMLACFEHWFGPYPFYDDGYKIIQAPFLGMEHQSGIAYGNHFENGYKMRDLSESGWGLKWDFILIHESGHEWFGNNITSKDIADMWIHEAFTNYSEVLFTECEFGLKAGQEYSIGLRHNIVNDKPIIGEYHVHDQGSGDMYYKGSNMLHTIRQIVKDDEKFRLMLREINHYFYHQTVTSEEVETFINEFFNINFDVVFDQYLRTVDVQIFEYKLENGTLKYRWANCVEGFDMSFRNTNGDLVKCSTNWSIVHNVKELSDFIPNENFYIQKRKL